MKFGLVALLVNAAFGDVKTAAFTELIKQLNKMKQDLTTSRSNAQKAFNSKKNTLEEDIGKLEATILNKNDKRNAALAHMKDFLAQAKKARTQAEQMETDLNVANNDKSAATKVYALESSTNTKTTSDLSAAVSMGKSALTKIKEAATTFAGTKKSGSGNEAGQTVDQATTSAGAINNVMQIMEEMIQQFQKRLDDQKADYRAATNAKNNLLTMLEKNIQTFDREMDNNNANADTHKTNAGEQESLATSLEGQLADDNALLAQNKDDLDNAVQQNEQEIKDNNDNINAIVRAIEIFRQGDMGYTAPGHTKAEGFLQRGVSLLQASVASSNRVGKAVAFLQSTDSPALLQLASSMRDGPFDKVIGMINDMLKNLNDQIKAGMTHNAKCTGDLAKNEESRNAAANSAVKSKNAWDKASAKNAQQIADQQTAESEIKDTKKARSAAAVRRAEDKKMNEANIEKLTTAMSALEEGRTALHNANPPLPAANMEAIDSLLNTMEANFDKSKEDAESSEAKGKESFKALQAAAEKTIITNTRAIEQLKLDQLSSANSKTESAKDYEAAQQILKANLKGYDALRNQCLKSGESYKDRAKKRDAEIQNLNQALQILTADKSEE